MTQIKSQILGLILGLATAIGCIFYEKIVNNFSYLTFIFIFGVELTLLGIAGYCIFPNTLSTDINKLFSDSKYIWWAVFYICTGVTSLLWYIITKDKGVMTGSIYEVKYIVMLSILYIIFGDNKFTINTAIGVMLAIGSMYFISK